MVSIICMTYNHDKYIQQCLQSIVNQKTNFLFEVIIHDDASSDQTTTIIRRYKEKYDKLIYLILEKENQFSLGRLNGCDLIKQARGKYIAYCEGDDYWIDEYKLQKQVDFLEKNNEYGLCHTKAKIFYQDTQTFDSNLLGLEVKDFSSLLYGENNISTLTVCMRKSLLMNYYNDVHPEDKGWLMGDYPMWLWVAYHSRTKLLSDVTAVYRFLNESVSHTNNLDKKVAFNKSVYDIKMYYIQKYSMNPIPQFDEHRFRAYVLISQEDEFENWKEIVYELENMKKITEWEKIMTMIYKFHFLRNLYKKYLKIKRYLVKA